MLWVAEGKSSNVVEKLSVLEDKKCKFPKLEIKYRYIVQVNVGKIHKVNHCGVNFKFLLQNNEDKQIFDAS